MSVFAALPMASDWQPHRLGTRPGILGSGPEEIGLGLGLGRIQTSTLERPPLKSHRSFPNSLTASYSTSDGSSQLVQPSTSVTEDEYQTSTTNEQKQAAVTPQQAVETTYGGSAPASPLPQVSPTSAEAENEDAQEGDDDLAGLGEEGDDDGQDAQDGNQGERTAEQRRADKRKMKRFRLTHNQTRFLMGEFARQAHPDAAQRERLAKEIPGLSPRQVQVWFQNRRAKLKRLTADDRERMMKSRALPEDFDMTQALHSPFAAGIHQPFSQQYSTPLQSPAAYSTAFNESGLIRPPLMVTGIRRESEDESTISPISISSNFNTFYTPPGSITTSDNMSPISPTAERAPFHGAAYPQAAGNRGTNPFSRSGSFSTGLGSHIPRLHLAHDRLARTRAESLGSPLRTSMSYAGNLDFASSTTEETVPASNNSGIQPARSYPTDTSSMSKSTGFSYLPHASFQSSALARPRPNFPPGLDLRSSYSRSLYPFSNLGQQQAESQAQGAQTPTATTVHGQPHGLTQNPSHAAHQTQAPQSPHHSLAYSSAPLAPPHDFQLPNSSELYGVSYPSNESEVPNFGVAVNSAPNTATISEHQLEPESYYKSEPENRRISLSHHSGHTPQQEAHHFSPTLPAHAGQMMHQQHQHQHQQQQQQQQPQHYATLASTPRSAGLKRRRADAEDEELVGRGQLGAEMGSSQRRRSFTLPSGYGNASNQ